MRRRRITFAGSAGDELAARLDLPDDEPQAYALFAHCFTCSKDVVAASTISAGLVEQGVGVLRFDFTGLGSSDGEFANTDFSSNVEDLVLAADMLRESHSAPRLLVGHSLGGAAVLAAATHIPESTAVATIGAPHDPAHVIHLLDDADLHAVRTAGEASVTLAGREFRIRSDLLEDLSAQNMDETLRNLDRALLVMHSPVDNQVTVEDARLIYEAARHPKSFLSLDDADHLLSKREDGSYAAAVLASWARRYVQLAPGSVDVSGESPTATTAARAQEGTVTVGERGQDGDAGFTQDVHAGSHRFRADEPEPIGSDLGPSPYDLLLAALGACTTMTLRMYAERKDIPLRHASVIVDHTREHARDGDDAANSTDNDETQLERITRTVHLDGPELTDGQRTALLAIADRCPVHRTLTGELRVDTSAAEGDGGDAAG